jgi:L-glyceraldehyde 3-phosphate reductase
LGFWHNFGEGTPYETSRQIALYAFDHGVTHFDLANNYGPEPGDAERRLGRLLREDLHSYRDELFISTKAGYDMWEGPYGSWASRKHMMASLDQSLSRMGLDYVDLFYCHRFDPETPLEESLQCLVDVVRSGKALYIGISRWPLEALQVAIPYLKERDVPLLIYQGRYNLLDREPETEGILDCLRENQTGFISFSPLAQGLLTDRYLNGIPAGSRMTENRFLKKEVLDDVLLNQLRQLNEMALQRGETLAQMALAWILNHPATTSVLVGASSVNQMEKNLCCMHSSPFSKEELHQVETILSGH